MQKIIRRFIIVVSAALVVAPLFVSAQNFSAADDFDVNISDTGINVTVKSGGTANSMTVNAGNVQFDMSSGHSVTLQSAQGYDLVESPDLAAPTCVGTGALTSQLVLTPSASQVYTVTPSTSKLCTPSSGGGSSPPPPPPPPPSGGGGGGGGGGAGAAPAPTTAAKPTPVKLAPPVTQEVNGTTGGTVALSDNAAKVTIPAGAVTGNANVSITPTATYAPPPASMGVVGGQAFDVAVSVGTTTVKTFQKDITLTFTYTDDQIKGLKESTLKVQYWDEAKKQWVAVAVTVDTAKNSITATIKHLTLFLIVGETTTTSAGSLIKLKCPAGAGVSHPCRSVYYLGTDFKRYVFPNETTYKSWYADFSGVKEIAQEELQTYPIRANVTIRPGTYLIKITTDPNVYAVEIGGLLRWIPSEAVAKKLYGDLWAKRVVDVSDAFFVNYNAAQAITNPVKETEFPNGTVVKYTSEPTTYYYIEGKKKRRFATGQALAANTVRSEFIITAPASMTIDNGTEISAREEIIASIPVR